MSKNRRLSRALFLLLLLTLMTLTVTACSLTDLLGTSETEAHALPAIWDTATYRADTTVGNGAKQVTLRVTADDATVTITLLTDEETLTDALLAAGLCQGETSQYGIYISHVNGIRANYTLDNGYWWNLLVNGESSMVGASDVTITAGDIYELVRTK